MATNETTNSALCPGDRRRRRPSAWSDTQRNPIKGVELYTCARPGRQAIFYKDLCTIMYGSRTQHCEWRIRNI